MNFPLAYSLILRRLCGHRITMLCAALAFTLLPAIFVDAQVAAAGQAPVETYRVRVENNLYGRIEVSLDGGQKYLLIGRVTHPATATLNDRSANQAGSVVRSSDEGFAFTTLSNSVLKLRPAQKSQPGTRSSAPRDSEIVSNLSGPRGLFGKLSPPAGSHVFFQLEGHDPSPFPDGYSVAAGDTILIVVTLPLPDPPIGAAPKPDADRLVDFQHLVRAQFESVAVDYADGAAARAALEKRKVVSGTLTLRPNVPPDEPDPITAITYSIDEQTVCARTTAPYLFGWDTSSVSDGEHVIEVRALSPSGVVITRTRYLVVVNNKSTTPPTPAK